MAEIAVFPGSFDPLTLGHEDVILRAAPLFEKLYIGLGKNTSKQYLIPQEQRLNALRETFSSHKNIEVIEFHGLTVDFCKHLKAKYIVRGLRSGTDFDYEKNIAFMNGQLGKDIQTIFFMTKPEYAGITSTIVREIYRGGGDMSLFVPKAALPFFTKR
jgi:pantetheine-phosphate adenylyltransferase